jgi:hypothetical protein
MPAARATLQDALDSADDVDDGSGVNRAERRRLEAQKRKDEKRR